ncbi:hypothetical protein [Gordonia sp. (in: high G+C Gram-positive bacteria)]|uniref:hypothetical protein n=1 Tax=Gordonia sp. (in: high G+C Gram-positive bacteria) TaxID=84139 RepID=UPI0039E40340
MAHVRVAAASTVLLGVALTACAVNPPTPPIPQPHWLGRVGCSIGDVLPVVDGLVRSGLRDAGYRHLIVEACADAPSRDAVATAAADRGVVVVTARPDRGLDIPATPDPARLRSDLTAAVMAARPIVVDGDPRSSAPGVGEVLANRDVLELAADERVGVGGPVPRGAIRVDPDGEVPEVSSRAIGRKGLIVALHNPRSTTATIDVATAALGLAGTIHGVDAWTGREYTSSGGRLGGPIGPGDTLLIRIV